MRRLTIEYGETAAGGGYEVIDEYGKRAGGLGFDEMLGQVVSMTHPKLGAPQFRMLTEDEWSAHWAALRARAKRNHEIVDAPLRDVLRQWQAAELTDDSDEMANARAARDRLIPIVEPDDMADIPF